jgi:hypothetical protein
LAPGISRHLLKTCSAWDGAMAEEEHAQSDGSGGQGLDPENGPTGAVVLLQKKAEKTVEEHLTTIVDCILDNIRAKHLPSAKLLIDLAARLETGKDVAEEEYVSLAEVLWTAFQEEERKTGTRD